MSEESGEWDGGGGSGVEGVPGLPGAPQDDAGLTRKFEMSHVGAATCRKTPISWSALDKNPMPGHSVMSNSLRPHGL